MGTWNWLDSTFLVVVFASVVTAAVKGFFRELISLASALASLAIAALGYRRAAVWFEDLTKSRDVALGLGFLTLLLATLALGALLTALARRLIKKAGLQPFDRFLGGVFGLVRGGLVDCVLLMALVAFGIKPEVVQQSVLAPYVMTGARVVVALMPEELKKGFQEGLEKFRQALIQHDRKGIKN